MSFSVKIEVIDLRTSKVLMSKVYKGAGAHDLLDAQTSHGNLFLRSVEAEDYVITGISKDIARRAVRDFLSLAS